MELILQAIKALFRKIEASRTHWDTRKIVTKEYTFDGNINGKEVIQITEDKLLVKVADTFPEVSSITNLSIVYTSIPDGLVDEYELSSIDDVWIKDGIYFIDGGAFYTHSGGEFEGVHIPSGLYFEYLIDDQYTSKLSVTYNDGELKKLDKKYLPDQTQPDWNQNDETAEDHIKNRTHYEEVIDEYVIFEGTLPKFDTTTGLPLQYAIPSNTRVTAYYNGSMMATVVGHYPGNGASAGTLSYGFSPDLYLTVDNSTMTSSVYNGFGDGVLKFVVENFTAVHTLDEKYLPSSVTSVGSLKMDKNNPVGTGSFSMGRKTGSSVGTYSHAEGRETTASGPSSHAEGYNTTAKGDSSHAEGQYTTASGQYSHAEGYSTTASGNSSHAEGSHTTASGQYSHVQGKYNIKDSQGKYAHIVGNGTNVSASSNAHTLDWNGNAWFAGDVYTGSTSGVNKDEGSKKLATEEYVGSKQDTLIQSGATVGQIAKITAVDSNGKPTAWQAVDMPSGAQPDWNQNDETAADYVKNRTHYEEVVLGAPTTYSSLFYTGRYTWGNGAVAKALVYAFDSVNPGFTNSAVLQSNTRTGNTRTLVYAIGSGTLAIVAMADEGKVVVTNNTGKSQKCSWEYPSTVEVVVHPLDEKYIPDSIARAKDIPEVPAIPTTLPNPHKLTFSGAVSAEYDGSKAVEVAIPSGGEVWRYLGKFETSEEVSSIVVSEDADGNPFALKKVIVSGLIAANNAAFTGWMKMYDQNGAIVCDLPSAVAQNDGGTVVGRGFQVEAWIIAGTYHPKIRLESVNTGGSAYNLTTVSGANGAFTKVDKVVAPESITKLTGKSYSSTPWGAGSYLHVWGVYA